MPPLPDTGGTSLVDPPCGPLLGVVDPGHGVRVFRGIPYSAPPLGRRRWRPPTQLPRWDCVRDATPFGYIAIQNAGPDNSLFASPSDQQSEDCLYLNVWTPLNPPPTPLPVLVWFHLGAFQFGSGSSPLYDGWRWARDGAVLVTVNYRLSKLGFLVHPELVEEGAGTAGNYGLLDQIQSLRWVHENIATFGGNPDCVTICGVSSGASSVALLMAAPAAHGLFHRAIAESGGAFGPVGAGTGVGDVWQDLDSAAASGASWSKSFGAASLNDLREHSADRIRTHSAPRAGHSSGVLDASRPIIDGTLLADSPHGAFTAQTQAAVPLLVGSAANEDLAMFNYPRDLTTFEQQAFRDHGAASESFFALYPATTDVAAVAAGLRSNGDRLFTWQNWRWANLHASAGYPVFYYRFSQEPPVPPATYAEQTLPRPLGAFHGASLFYLFGGAEDASGWMWSSRDIELADTLRHTWIHFARHGHPECGALPGWPMFDADEPKTMTLHADQCALIDVPARAQLTFWDDFYRSRLSMANTA